MFNFLKKNHRKLVSVWGMFSILFQNIIPLVFLPTTVFASTQQVNFAVSQIGLTFNNNSHEFALTGTANQALSYTLTYASDEEDAVENAVMGKTTAGEFAQKLYAGSCSAADCTPDNFNHGTLTFEQNSYQADFRLIDGVLWLTHDDVATVGQVQAHKTYVAPQNSDVSVIFTKLPDNPGSLSIKEIILTDEQVEQLGALSNKAYDITSDMEDGSFEYNLTLPIPENADEDTQVVYAEDINTLDNVKPTAETVDGETVVIDNLDHFTVFVVVNPNGAGNGNICTVASITGVCYDDLQTAVDAANDSGDTIELASDLTITHEVSLRETFTSLIIDGHGHTLTSPFTKTDDLNNAAFGVYGDNITIQNLIVDGTGGTDLHGINTYNATNVLLDNVTISNYRSGIVVNGSTVTVNNLSTSGNAWHGVNIDQGGGVVNPSILTVNGYSSHSDTLHIYMDDVSKDVHLIDPLSQYASADNVFQLGDRLFTLQDIAPSQATGIRILDHNGVDLGCGNATNNRYITVDWADNPEPDINHYDYMIREGNIISHPTASEYSGNIRNHDGDYRYRVRAVDNAGNEGAWSDWCGVTLDRSVPSSPTQTGYNEDNGDAYSSPRPVNELTCTGDATNINGISVHWTDVSASGSHVKYQRQFNKQGVYGWTGSEIYTNPYTNYRTFGGNPGSEATYGSRVRAWEDYDNDNVVDPNENVSDWSNECAITYDITAPDAPSLIEPVDNAIVNGAVLLSDWTQVSDAHHYIYESYHNAAATNLRWHAEYTDHEKTAYNVANATFWWRVKAVDAAGNESAWSDLWKVTVDNDSPAITLDLPAQNSFQRGNINLQATCNEECDYINFWWRAEGEAYSNVSPDRRYHYEFDNGTVFNWTLDSLNAERWDTDPSYVMADGDYYFYAAGKDVAGNWARTSGERKITIDNTKPNLTITSPTHDSALSGPFTVSGSASDDGSGIKDIRVRFRKESDSSLVATFWAVYDSNTNTWSLDINNGVNTIPDGNYRIVVRARDELNHIKFRRVRRVLVDNTAPSATIDSIKYSNGTIEPNKFVTNYSDPLVLGTATDNNSVASVVLNVNGHTYPATLAGSDWEANITDIIPDGLHTMTVTVTDAAGNIATTTQDIRIDTVAPTATYQQFDGATEVTGTTAYVNDLARLTFTGEYSDTDPSANLYWDSYVIFQAQDDGSFRFSHDGKLAFCSWRHTPNLVDISGSNTFSLTTPESFTNCTASLADGEYYMAHQVYDTATRKDIPSINQFRDVLGLHFIIDTVAPTVTATVNPASPDGNNGWYTSTPTITLTASDDQLLDHIEYHWDSDAWSVYTAPLTATQGTYTLYYRSFDAAGNVSAESSLVIKFDQIAPNPGPENLRVTNLSLPTATLEWDAAQDSNSGINSYDISWKLKDGPSPLFGESVAAGTTSLDMYGLTDGEWEIKVKAIDAAGNWTESLLLYVIGGGTGNAGETSTTTSNPPTTIPPVVSRFTGGLVQGLSDVLDKTEDSKKQDKAQSEETKQSETKGEILGATSCSTFQNYLPLILLLLQAIFIASFEIFSKKTKHTKIIVALILTVLTIVVFYILKDKDCQIAHGILSMISQWLAALSVVNGSISKIMASVFTD